MALLVGNACGTRCIRERDALMNGACTRNTAKVRYSRSSRRLTEVVDMAFPAHNITFCVGRDQVPLARRSTSRSTTRHELNVAAQKLLPLLQADDPNT